MTASKKTKWALWADNNLIGYYNTLGAAATKLTYLKGLKDCVEIVKVPHDG